jgi:osmotically inducible protein OsmC
LPRIERSAEVVWHGNLARGEGRLSAATGAFRDLPYSEPARVGAPEGKTSPEELLAAAHAGCYAMSLAGELARTPPERLEVRATVVMDEVEGKGHRIVASQLDVRARVPGLDEATFSSAVEAADAGCPFSALIAASADVAIDATLEGGG